VAGADFGGHDDVTASISEKAFVHESSYVDDGATIGAGTKVWHFCHVMPGAVIGERCSLGQNVVVMNGTRIGNNCKIQNNVSIYEGVELDDDVFCGPSMVFTNVINPRSHVSRKHEYRATRVRRGATIGANATIVCGVTLGEYSFIGAGAVVTTDVPAYALMVGVPARRIGWMCQCGERLPDSGVGRCAACGIEYERSGDGIRPRQRGDR
jgi:UDP-2-acetamido-3-amino-2,3-dideoxy-glucuronate N-acetyltransferase